ncbi:hypothetical protein [Prevotella nigrescens]|uniref:hypothetical protein n=1 Tax=Prevotella nigrescens TaxID=28133 RepID=UPI0028F14229|nr:hypothetical protein [Prevotella nigrescens]
MLPSEKYAVAINKPCPSITGVAVLVESVRRETKQPLRSAISTLQAAGLWRESFSHNVKIPVLTSFRGGKECGKSRFKLLIDGFYKSLCLLEKTEI